MKKVNFLLFSILGFFIANEAYAQFESNPLSQAVDNTRADFATESPSFFRQTNVFTTDGDAAQAGRIGNNGVSVMVTGVIGPTTLSFDWRVSSEAGFDFLALVVLDQNLEATNIVESISGNTGFSRITVNIPAGVFFPTWGYIKDGSLSSGQDTGWIDNVVIGNLPTSTPEDMERERGDNTFIPAVLDLLLSE